MRIRVRNRISTSDQNHYFFMTLDQNQVQDLTTESGSALHIRIRIRMWTFEQDLRPGLGSESGSFSWIRIKIEQGKGQDIHWDQNKGPPQDL